GLSRSGPAPGPAPAVIPRQQTAPAAVQAQAPGALRPTGTPVLPNPYVVAPGDSLSAIATGQHVEGGWQALYETNRATIGGNPDLIFPGQRLTLRVTTAPVAPPAPNPEKPPRVAEPVKPVQPAAPEPERAKPEQAKPAESASAKEKTATGGFSAPVDAAMGTAYRVAGSSWSSGYHTGVDFPVPTGTSIKAVGPGTVLSAGWAGAYGYQVVIRHADGRYSQYAHLSALGVKAGQQVSGGQRIGRSGSTGNTTGPHLHFEMRTGPGYGTDIDPLKYLRGRGADI
ncbi:M23 family metallopeptidase, partial [Streptomyces sp. NPDC054838]